MSTPFATGELVHVEVLKSMKVGKAPGPDDIHPEFLLHVWKDVKSPKSGARQLSLPS